ncbi:MAG: GspE/PulE family protein [Candidatus Omnitrophica bacterium]|nr:GspE/PulE family protein [Candidatus Omnitrophota bacterium]
MAKLKLGEMLLEEKLITPQQLEAALAKQRKSGNMLGEILLKEGFITEEQLLQLLSKQLSIPYLRIIDKEVPPAAVRKVPAKFVYHYEIMPIEFNQDTNTLTVAAAYPLKSLEDIKVFLECELEVVFALRKEIDDMIKKYYAVGAETVEGMIGVESQEAVNIDRPDEEVQDIEKAAEDASIIKLVNQIILDAHSKRATDIHLEPFRGKARVRYRIDGVLQDANVSADMGRFFHTIVSRIKIMCNLNIVERRLPQDGRTVVRIGKEEFDLRISILPTSSGESIVIRILPAKMLFSLKKLGLEERDQKQIESLISRPHGIILVTGPTGSGKTTTLYASLKKIKGPENKIITLEDPVEYQLEGITQMQVLSEIGLTFSKGLRSILRHDPDIIMVGEVRDFETAELAIRVALTGHLIFSTLHTNSAAGGITRLLDMGVEPYLLSSSVEAFIAQRLVRLICPHCKEKDEGVAPNIKKEIKKSTGVSNITFYKGRGCEACNNTGFRGRTAIYEILEVGKNIRNHVLERASADQIKETAVKQGMRTLRVAGWQKVIDGLTTVEEVMRVSHAEE